VDKLSAGRLLATGLRSPMGHDADDLVISAGQWRVLKLDVDRESATGNVVTYTGVRIREG